MRALVYDVAETLEGVQKHLLDTYGEAPSLKAMEKWLSRKSAPGVWILALLGLTNNKNSKVYLIDRTKRVGKCQELNLDVLLKEEEHLSKVNTKLPDTHFDLFS